MRALPALLLVACTAPGRLDLRLRAPDDTDLEALETLTVTLAAEGSDERVLEGQVRGDQLADLATIFERADLDPGRRFVFEASAASTAGGCASGRVEGRSVPFELESDDGDQTVAMYVACADSFARTEGRMRAERATFAAVWHEPSRAAVLLGGASRAVFGAGGEIVGLEPLGSVERYDVATGEFSDDEPLVRARTAPAAEVLADDRILVAAGLDSRPGQSPAFGALDAVEVLDGPARMGIADLANKWIEIRSLPLAGGTIALVGAAYDGVGRPVQAEVYDAALGQNVASVRAPFGETQQRFGSALIAFDGQDRALLAGGSVRTEDGVVDPMPPPEIFDGSAPCEDGATAPPCLELIGAGDDPATFGPGPVWRSAAAVWAPCESGGGAAFVMGGEIGVDPSEEVAVIYCFRDDPGSPPGPLRAVGALANARAGARATLVRGSRVLVVGGATRTGGVQIAELFPVDGCSCDQPIGEGDIQQIPIDLDSSLLVNPVLATLGDGTVLVGGAVVATLVGGGEELVELAATSEAWVFEPSL